MLLTERAKIGLKALSKKQGYTYEEMLENQKMVKERAKSKNKKGQEFHPNKSKP
jgi:hypothetical protein